jgi:signal transduction histidine kinase
MRRDTQAAERKKVLVVEDEALVGVDLQARLERLGYAAPAVADDGLRALQLLRSGPFDLVLMDIRLKGEMDGIRAAEVVQREHDLPVVYVTAYADSRTVQRAQRTHAGGYLVKPVRDAALRSAIEIALHNFRRTQDVVRNLTLARRNCDSMAEQLKSVRENECRRLARELHDDIQQRISALALELEMEARHAPAETRRVLDLVCSELRRLNGDLVRLAHDLHPQMLEKKGLAVAIQRLCRAYGLRGLNMSFVNEAPPARLPADVEFCLYRVAQESLHNLVKHSQASAATVRLERIGTNIELRIADNGCGFDPETAARGSPLGLLNMRERVKSVNGTLNIISAPGMGTEIQVAIPLAKRS